MRALPVLGAGGRLTVVTVPTIYPAGGERQLIQALTGHEIPSLAYPTDVGYLCQNVGTAAALYRFLQFGEPLTRRITTVAGRSVARPGNLEVRFGTRISDLVAGCGDCVRVCPAHLMPQELYRAVKRERLDKFEDHGLFDCIECGCCDIVCPSHIRLTESFRAGKEVRLLRTALHIQ